MFVPVSPYIHTLYYGFTQMPEISVSIKPLKLIDLMDLPLIQRWMTESLRYITSITMVLPEQVTVPYYDMYNTEGSESPDTESEQLVEAMEMEPSSSAFQNIECAGILIIRLIQAKKLLLSLQEGNAKPYCILTFGDHVLTSKEVKRNRNPIWNELFEFPLEKDDLTSTKQLEITMMGRSEGGDKLLG